MRCRLCCRYRSNCRRPFLALTFLGFTVLVWNAFLWTRGAWSQSDGEALNVVGIRQLHAISWTSNVSEGGGIASQFKAQIPYGEGKISRERPATSSPAPLSTQEGPLSTLSTYQQPGASTEHPSHSLVDDDVLDSERIKIMPRVPVVAEGHSLQVSCVVKQLLVRQEREAPYLSFEFPPMEEKYEEKISVSLRPGEHGWMCMFLTWLPWVQHAVECPVPCLG